MRIVQITDSHVLPEGALWKGRVDGGSALARAVARINGIGADLVVHTGDLTDGGDRKSTERAAAILAGLRAPLRLSPGNHDDRDALRACFGPQVIGEGPFLNWRAEAQGLRIIGLDTLDPGEVAGRLCTARAAWLEEALEGDMPSVVFQHHPPCAMGLPFMDGWPFQGEAEAARIISAAPALRILCGHVHAAAERHWAGTLVAAAPALSVALPFDATREEALGFMVEPPMLRVLDWDETLGLRVQTIPVAPGPGPFFWFDPREE